MRTLTTRLAVSVAGIALSVTALNMPTVATAQRAGSTSATAAIAQASTTRPREARWFESWEASPAWGMPEEQVPTGSLEGDTLRLIVQSTLAGDRARLRLSNLYGDKPLLIERATIARSASDTDAAISGRAVPARFNGKRSITIQPGGMALSDPINFTVPARSNLAVSLYLPTADGPATAHEWAWQNSYVASGDQTTARNLPGAAVTTTRYFLTGVDVESRKGRGTIVALGDSITNGYLQWPDQLAGRLGRNHLHYAVANAGISGNGHVVESRPAFGEHASARFDRDVLSLPNVTHLIVSLGINDIGQPGVYGGTTVSAQQIIASMAQLAARAQEHGIKAYAGTLTPFEGSIFYTPQGEVTRQKVNRWIRTTDALDGFIDFDAAIADPNHPPRLRPTYDFGDHLHLSRAGHIAMAEAIDLSMFR